MPRNENEKLERPPLTLAPGRVCYVKGKKRKQSTINSGFTCFQLGGRFYRFYVSTMGPKDQCSLQGTPRKKKKNLEMIISLLMAFWHDDFAACEIAGETFWSSWEIADSDG